MDPAAVAVKLPKDLKWSENASGSRTAILAGNPSQSGLYIILYKWSPNRMSRPHWHPKDRFISVLSGTWWVGTGAKYDPASMTPISPGSFVTHFANQIHYDGAKDEETTMLVIGEGPVTSVPAEKKD